MDAPDQVEFDTWLHSEIVNALDRLPRDFAALTAALPGVYPYEVFRTLHVIMRQQPHISLVAEALAASAKDRAAVQPAWSGLVGLPPPHPLDFEWRFAPAAIARIAERIGDVSARNSRVALIGTPTLAVNSLASLGPFVMDYYGLDAHNLMSAGLVNHLNRTESADLLREVSIVLEQYDTIIMDPPWYDDYVCRFLHFAARALRIGGHLLTAMPPRGTRPGVETAKHKILVWAERLGLVVESKHLGFVPYETPIFERNALRAAGILNVASDWRVGDLWILRKAADREVEWPGDLDHSIWQEFAFGPVRLRVDCGTSCEGSDPRLKSIVDGDVLPSVSRRDLRRIRARVWTTGNRVFACEAPAKFAACVTEWQNSPTGSMSDAARLARTHLFELIDRERAELAWPARKEAHSSID